MKKTITFIAVVVVLYSCGTKQAVQKQPEPVETETTSAVIIENGKNLYEGKCGKCHDLPKVNAFSHEKWDGILKWMQPKAKITDKERGEIYFYLTRQL
jgi:cytochrome c5